MFVILVWLALADVWVSVQSVLYLMVVTLPTEDQLEEARKATGQSDA